MNLLFELPMPNTISPEMYSLIIDWGLGCPVCMLKPLVYVTKRSEYRVVKRGSGLPQNVRAFGKTSKRERLELLGFLSVEHVNKFVLYL